MSESTSAIQAPNPGIWASLREAVVGSSQDFTESSISRSIFLLAVPMVLEMCMESLFGVVDVFWVSRLGADAVATVGLTETALTLIFVIALGLSMGATAMVARRIGEKDPRAASETAAQAIIARRSIQKFTSLQDLKAIPGVDASIVDSKARLIFFK